MRIELLTKSEIGDSRDGKIQNVLNHAHPGCCSNVQVVDVYCVPPVLELDRKAAQAIFSDEIVQLYYVDKAVGLEAEGWTHAIEIAFKAGVTDPVGISATEALMLEKGITQRPAELVQSAVQYLCKINSSLSQDDIAALAKQLYNPLIQRVEIISRNEMLGGKHFPALYKGVTVTEVHDPELFDLANLDDKALEQLSKKRLLALTLSEMQIIRSYYQDKEVQKKRASMGLGSQATDVELEMLAQTWSEHCKHKIFSANIDYLDENKKLEKIPGVFKTFIKATTDELSAKRPDLRSVFHDNAGVVDFDEEHVVCFKAETHNSPSALDPYGGAITGIVGVNRDVLGTGIGARPLFNTNVLCFADPETPKDQVPSGLLHPSRIMHGVHEGIIDGGNQSGIPTVGGAFVFDETYIGKPLVYCGTGGIMPRQIRGVESWKKHIDNGDYAVMIGGRIGKDGIHGATFSSLALDEDSPSSAVQIGDPITQRKVWDFLMEARDKGLYNSLTDNGAGGLSSSLGEMAQSSGGVRIDLDKAPLKYPGLSPWEIWVSESQERMSIAVSAAQWDEFSTLAKARGVEATILGEFINNGLIDLYYKGKRVAALDMEFVHEGLPKMNLKAQWIPDHQGRSKLGQDSIKAYVRSVRKDITGTWKSVLGDVNVRSREELVRKYDHEVQGNTRVKPYAGLYQDAPGDGSVIRPVPGSEQGLTVTHGICPRVGDDDTYKMAVMAVDEAYRSHIALGGDPDRASLLDNFCWPDPVESADTPDGQYKLAQLVRANKGLRDACLAYNLPLISGKDSMKNDARAGGKKISIRPTLLTSLMGIVPDTRLVPVSGFAKPGSSIYLLGFPQTSLGGSVLEAQAQKTGVPHLGQAPGLDLEQARKFYESLSRVIANGLVESIHDVSDGGLAVTLSEMSLYRRLGFDVDLTSVLISLESSLSTEALESIEKTGDAASWMVLSALFGEGPGTFACTCAPGRDEEFIDLLDSHELHFIGQVRADSVCSITWESEGRECASMDIADILSQWKRAWN